jgi:EmrB/QacA subfamily drug resistance transporter
VLITTVLASSLAFIDSSVVNVGLRAIGDSLHSDASGLAWTINAYLLPLSALLLTGGALGDQLGRRFMLVAGTSIFAVASLICALAPNLAWLLAGRAGQGLGAAILMPNSLAVLSDTFQGEARGRAVGFWAAAGAGASAIGPLLGGFLIDHFGWRSIFIINLPLAAAAIIGALIFVPASRHKGAVKLDAGGALIITLSLFCLTWGIILASVPGTRGLTSSVTIGIGLAALAGFLLLERRLGNRAMMPLALFSSYEFAGLNTLTFLLYAAMGGLFMLIPFILIGLGGYDATSAGAALLPLPVILGIASPTFGRLAGRIGARPLLIAGPLVAAAGTLLLLRIGSQPAYLTTVAPGLIVIAIGMSCAVAPLTTAVLSSVDQAHTGVASGLNSAVARTGSLLAIAMLSGVLAAQGAELLSAFHAALICIAAACALSGGCALILRNDRR